MGENREMGEMGERGEKDRKKVTFKIAFLKVVPKKKLFPVVMLCEVMGFYFLTSSSASNDR